VYVCVFIEGVIICLGLFRPSLVQLQWLHRRACRNLVTHLLYQSLFHPMTWLSAPFHKYGSLVVDILIIIWYRPNCMALTNDETWIFFWRNYFTRKKYFTEKEHWL